MQLKEAIFTRRSVRAYTEQPVPRSMVETLLRAAMQAPSANNRQPWQFVVLDDRRVLQAVPNFHPYAKMLPTAQLGIVVCADEELQPNATRWVQDCAAATQNLLLMAHDLGLGAVWLGLYGSEDREQGMRNLLKLPVHIHPFSLISIGFPLQVPAPEDRYKAERVHENHW